jgi:hypothetical protein
MVNMCGCTEIFFSRLPCVFFHNFEYIKIQQGKEFLRVGNVKLRLEKIADILVKNNLGPTYSKRFSFFVWHFLPVYFIYLIHFVPHVEHNYFRSAGCRSTYYGIVRF